MAKVNKQNKNYNTWIASYLIRDREHSINIKLYNMTAQIIYLAMALVGLLLVANKHGKPRDNYNFWNHLIASIIQLAILYWGGFFNCFTNI